MDASDSHLLRGMIFCDTCGRDMIPAYSYSHPIGEEQHQRPIDAAVIENEAWEYVRDVFGSEQFDAIVMRIVERSNEEDKKRRFIELKEAFIWDVETAGNARKRQIFGAIGLRVTVTRELAHIESDFGVTRETDISTGQYQHHSPNGDKVTVPVSLTRQQMAALEASAERDMRDPNRQAMFLIVKELSSDLLESNWARLRKNLEKYLDESELRSLCFDMDIGYDGLPGASSNDKGRELILFCKRTSRTADLIAQLTKLRPNVCWEDMPE